ncbi:MAG: tRNA uridine(34) 5-carboxymethylaminomethyl modification radical SAM/GNAT enzyme Elp3, partial [Candidatus Ranarchaeia archaeon]
MPNIQQFVFELIRRIDPARQYSAEEINKIKIQICRDLHLPGIPRNSTILRHLPVSDYERWTTILRTKRSRSLSGVVVVAVMTRPAPCPHGRCDYCPGGPEVGAPQSYTGCEPAALRALQNQFDPYLQVKSRLAQYQAIGHPIDKIELIIMGGTFPSQPVSYQKKFIQGCIDATLPKESASMAEAQVYAEKAKIRISGITVETRPDTCSPRIIKNMLYFGVTRFELGVQTIHNDIYKRVNRGHTVKDVTNATKWLKDAGLKVCYHIMPNLPGSNLKRDHDTFNALFELDQFKPDMLKIYPLLILKGTKIYEDWSNGNIQIYTDEEIIDLIATVSSKLPPWVRIQRIQRDIPAPLIVAGPRKSNLGEYVQRELERRGSNCNCIRCREIGIRVRQRNPPQLNS